MANLNGAAKAAKEKVLDCAAALQEAKLALQGSQADLAAAEAELHEVQAAACPSVDDAMSVDAAAGHAVVQELAAYLATCPTGDPNVRAILAKFGPILGVAEAPWAGAVPPPFPTQSQATAESLSGPEPLSSSRGNGKGGSTKSAGTRIRSGSRSPPPGGKGSSGGAASSGPPSKPIVDGLANLQSTLGLNGDGIPVPEEDDV